MASSECKSSAKVIALQSILSLVAAYQISTQEAIYHIAQDITRPDLIHLSSSRSFWTKSHADINPTLRVGSQKFGYEEQTLNTTAKFRHIRSFAQISIDKVILVDSHNQCLRLLNLDNNLTSQYAGKCDGRERMRTPNPDGATFQLPTDIAFQDQTAYVTDFLANSIYMLLILPHMGEPLIEKLDLQFDRPMSVVIGRIHTDFYVSTFRGVEHVNISETVSGTSRLVISESYSGSINGNFLMKLVWLNHEKTNLAVVNQNAEQIDMFDFTSQNTRYVLCSPCHRPATCSSINHPMSVAIWDTVNPDVKELLVAAKNGEVTRIDDSRRVYNSATTSQTTCSTGPSFQHGVTGLIGSDGAVIGMSIGALILACIPISLIVYYCRKRKANESTQNGVFAVQMSSLNDDNDNEIVLLDQSACNKRDDYQQLPNDEVIMKSSTNRRLRPKKKTS